MPGGMPTVVTGKDWKLPAPACWKLKLPGTVVVLNGNAVNSKQFKSSICYTLKLMITII